VHFIHQNGMVHLDLSLENVLLTKQNVVKICDFGLAKEGKDFKLSTRPGKLPYMAPEIFELKEFDGQKADVWSLGVILWCLLTSLALYEVPADSDARFLRLRSGKKGIKELLQAFQVDGIPDIVIDLLCGMLHLNPQYRFNMNEVLDHPWLIDPLDSSSIPTSIASSSSMEEAEDVASEIIYCSSSSSISTQEPDYSKTDEVCFEVPELSLEPQEQTIYETSSFASPVSSPSSIDGKMSKDSDFDVSYRLSSSSSSITSTPESKPPHHHDKKSSQSSKARRLSVQKNHSKRRRSTSRGGENIGHAPYWRVSDPKNLRSNYHMKNEM